MLTTSLGWFNATPAHIGDVEEAVDATEVDEGAVLGDVLDDRRRGPRRSLQAWSRVLPRLRALALLLEEGASGQDDVTALLVELDDLEVGTSSTDELVEVAGDGR